MLNWETFGRSLIEVKFLVVSWRKFVQLQSGLMMPLARFQPISSLILFHIDETTPPILPIRRKLWRIPFSNPHHYLLSPLLSTYPIWCSMLTLPFSLSIRRSFRLLVTANVPSSPILVTLIMEALGSSKRRFLQEPRGITTQKTAFFTVTAVNTSNLTRKL
jgi:hypothetical protein